MARQAAQFELARKEFHQRREWLEAKFFELASGSGKPRGLRWTDCDFDNDVTYARNRNSDELCAFVAVTIAFEAIEGGLMEGVEAVANLRAATSVFRHAARPLANRRPGDLQLEPERGDRLLSRKPRARRA